MKNYVEEFCTYLETKKNLSKNSITAYRHDVNLFLEQYPDVTCVNRTQVMSFLLSLQKQNRKISTQARCIISLRAFFAFLHTNGYIDIYPMDHIQIPKAPAKIPYILTVEEVDRLLSQPDLSTQKGVRDKAMLEFLYASGMKVSEIIDVKVSDVHIEFGCVEYHDRDHSRIIPLGKTCLNY